MQKLNSAPSPFGSSKRPPFAISHETLRRVAGVERALYLPGFAGGSPFAEEASEDTWPEMDEKWRLENYFLAL